MRIARHLMVTLWLLILGLWLASLFVDALASSAAAQPATTDRQICGPAAGLVEIFAQNYGEHPIGGGQVGPGHALLVLASPDGAGWSIVVVQAATGMACLLAKGTDWDPGALRALPGKGS